VGKVADPGGKWSPGKDAMIRRQRQTDGRAAGRVAVQTDRRQQPFGPCRWVPLGAAAAGCVPR